MKKAAFILPLGLVLGLTTASIAFAKTTIEISNNGENSKSSINVNNNTSGSDSTTHVKITTNGETKEYITTGDEDINVQSSDGNSKVQITNNSSKNSTNSGITDEKKAEIKKKIKEKITKINENSDQKEIKISEFFKDKWDFLSKIIFFWR